MAQDVEIFLKLIESQSLVCERFSNIQRIDNRGGGGAHSLVFTAHDCMQKKGKPVVLKFFNPLLTENFYRRECFQRESKILEKLRGQRNILPIIKELTVIGLNLDTPMGQFPLQFSFYVSYKAKESVKDYLYSNKNHYLKSIGIFRQITKAVQRIHNNKIFHRDLKPANFLIFPFGYVCLSDFGSARDYVDGNALLDDYGKMEIGDPRYSSFETLCFLRTDQDIQRKADFFSLGAILFELFTKSVLSQILFQGNLSRAISLMRQVPEKEKLNTYNEIIKQIVIDNPLPSIRKVNSEIPKQISTEIDKLYGSLSNLDFRNRETSFENIFSKINLCEKHIKYFYYIQKKNDRKRKVKV